MRRSGSKYNAIFRIWGILASMFVILVVLTASTYAWFTSNRIVSTDRVEARSGTDTLELQISTAGGSAFTPSEEAAIVQVNQTSLTNLLPVSTADLSTFVSSRGMDGDMAISFLPVENEEYYYHGAFYIRASAEGQPEGAKMALYFDEGNEVGGALARADSGMLLNAARLGLTFDKQNPAIFYLSDTQNESSQQAKNTKLNGTILGDHQVLQMTGGEVRAVSDPSIALSERTIVMENNRVQLPNAPLIEMELNRIYLVDVYLYLEGCDPDCSNSICTNEADLHLAFYGILQQ